MIRRAASTTCRAICLPSTRNSWNTVPRVKMSGRTRATSVVAQCAAIISINAVALALSKTIRERARGRRQSAALCLCRLSLVNRRQRFRTMARPDNHISAHRIMAWAIVDSSHYDGIGLLQHNNRENVGKKHQVQRTRKIRCTCIENPGLQPASVHQSFSHQRL